MKLQGPFRILSSFLTGLMLLLVSAANATTYYSSGNNDPGVLSNWWANVNGTGAHPANFTGAADVFTVQNGNTYTTTGTWTISGSVTVATGGALVIAAATTVTIPTLTSTGTGLVTNDGTLTVSTTLTGTGGCTNAATGTFNYPTSNAIGITTFTTTAAGNTVNYSNAGAQTVKGQVYSNLTLSGSGAKTTTTVTVNGILNLAGTATVTVVPTYGASSTLEYSGSAAQTTGLEFPASFTGTGGVISNNSLGVTMNAAKTVSQLTVNAGASFSTGATSTFTLTVTGNTSVTGILTINNAGTMTFGGTLTVNSGGTFSIPNIANTVQVTNLTVASGGTLLHNQNYASSNYLGVSGNLLITGTYNYVGYTPAIYMNATTTANINTGTTSVFYLLLRTATYSAVGPVTVDGPFYAMWNAVGGSFHTNGQTVIANWGVVNSGGTLFIDGAGTSLTINGANGGLLSGHSVAGQNGAVNMSAGTLTTPGLYIGINQVSPAANFSSTFTQSAGTINVNGPTVIDASTVASSYIQSGGTLNANGGLTISSPATFVCSNSPAIYVGGNWTNTGTFTPATSTVTFNGTANQTISNSAVTSFNNLIINPSATMTASVATNNISILSNLTVSTGILDLGTFSANRTAAGGTLTVASGAELRLSGGSGGPAGSNFPNQFSTNTINAASTVEYYGTVAQTVYNTPAYGNLIVSGNSTKTAGGALTIAGNMTINTSAIFAGSTYSHTVTGNWYNNVSTTAYTGTSTVTLNGSAGQTIGGTAGTTFNNLTVNDAGGVSISQDQTVNSTLTLTSGNFTIGTNNLIFGSSAVAVAGGPFSATKMIVADGGGEVRKDYSAVGSYIFPIGSNAGVAVYSPITLNYTSGTFAGGAYTGVKVTDAKDPSNASTTDYLTRYWTASNSGITSPSFTATATYITADVTGTEANIAAAKYTGALPWVKYGVISSHTLTSTAVTNTGTGIDFSGISNQVPVATISGGGVSFCSGGSASLSTVVTSNGTGSISYTWSPATGLSSTNISNPLANPTATTTYSLTVTDGNGITNSPAATTTITINPLPAAPTASVTAQPTCTVATGTITITAPTAAGMTYSTDGVTYTNTTGIFTGMAAGSYNLTAKNSGGCISTITAVTVNAQPSTPGAPTVTPILGPPTFCAGGNVTLSCSAGTTYLWSTGAITQTIIVSTAGSYTAQVTNSSGCQSASSSPLVVTVNALPAITAQPSAANQTVCQNGSATALSVTATGAGITYQWYSNTSNSTSGGTFLSGASSSTYTPVTTFAGLLYYYVIVSGTCTPAATSTVSGSVNVVGLPAAPTITAGGPTTFCTGGSVTLTSSAGTTYLWSTSATSSSISPTTAGSYTVQVTNASGCQSAASLATVVTVNTLPGTPTITAGGPTTFCAGGSVTLTSSAGTTYLWSTAATSSSISPTTTGSYTVQVTNASGCQSASSSATVVTVNALPAITVQPSAATQTVCLNAAATTISVTATGAGITYQWYSNTTNSTIGGTLLSGATSSTYAPVTSAAGTLYYYVIVSGTCTPAVTSTVSGSVTVNALPAITAQPSAATQTLCQNAAATALSVTATGAGITYQWYSNTSSSTIGGTLLSGATSSTYTPVTSAAGTLYYYVIVSGTCTPAVTSTVSGFVTVNALPGTPTITAGGPTTFCAGGSVTLTSSAGTTYLWSTAATSSSISPTTAGSYTVQVTNASGCQSASSSATVVTVNALPAITVQPSAATQTICLNAAATTLSVTATGAGITYQWYSNTSSSTIGGTLLSGATSSTYVPVTSAAGTLYYYVIVSGTCTPAITSTVSGSVTVNTLPAITAQPSAATQILCQNAAATTLSVTATGAGITYQWYSNTSSSTVGGTLLSGATSSTYTPVTSAAGTLYYYVIVSGTCTPAVTSTVSGSVTVNALPATPTITAGGPTTFCAGGSVTLTSSAGTTYLWSTSATSSSISPTTAGSYTVQVTNASGCQSASSLATVVTVNALPATPTITAGGPTTFCAGGSVTLTSSAGTTYLWSTAATTSSISPTTAGSYTVRVTNASGCQSASSSATVVTVNALPAITVQPSAATQTVCLNAGATTLSVTATGAGITYQWYSNTSSSTIGGTLLSGATSSTYAPVTSAAGTLYYYVIVSGTCTPAITSTVSGSVTVNALPAITVQPSAATQTLCQNAAATTLSVTATGAGITYQWYSNTSSSTIGGTLLSGATSSTYTPVTSAAGTLYYYVIVSGTCTPAVTSTVSGSVTVNALPAITVQPSAATQTVCLNAAATTLSVTATGAGITYQWYSNTSSSTSGGTLLSGATSSTYAPVTSGAGILYYYVIVSGTCTPAITSTVSGSVTVNTLPAITAQPSAATQTLCQNAAATTLSVTATGAGITYQWYSNTSSSTIGGTLLSGATSSTYTPVTSAAGTLYYYVIVSGTCTPAVTSTVSGSVTVNALPATPTITAGGPTTFCAGGSVTLTSSAGTTYLWSTSATSSSISPTTAGSYTVQVTNASGCQSASSLATVVTVNALPATPTITAGGPTTFCAGGSVTLTSSAGTTYLWSTAATTSSISPTTAGSYTVRVTNASGCQSASSSATVVTVNALPAITVQPSAATQTVCLNAGATTLSVTATGTGITYQWYSNTSSSTIGGTLLSGATSSTYAPVTSAAGTLYYYVIVSGTCTPAITSTVSGSVTVNTLPAITAQPSAATQTLCQNAAATALTVTATGAGITYQWYSNTSSSTIGGTLLSGATSSTYTPVTSAAGTLYYYVIVSGTCTPAVTSTVSGSVTVNALPATPTITAGGPTTFCAGGSVTLTSSAGTTYLWSTSATSSSISPTTAGSYTVQVTNASGCQSASSLATVVTVNALPGTPTITAGGPTTFCAGGSVTLTSSVGTTYLWSTAATTSSISPTTAGSYTVRVTNASGCQSASSSATVVTVNALPAITVQPSAATQTVCLNAGATTLSVTATGAGITYQWYSNTSSSTVGGTLLSGATSSTYAPVTSAAGTLYYYVIVSGTCTPAITSTVSGSVTVNALPAITAQPSAATQTLCQNAAATTLSVTATGAGITYQWYSNTSSSTIGGTLLSGATSSTYTPVTSAAGTLYYYVIVSGTCTPAVTSTVSGSVTVNALPAAPTASVTAQPTCTVATGTVTISAPTGAGMTYSSDGITYTNTTGVFSGMAAGTYNFTARSNTGCISSTTSMTVNAQPVTPTGVLSGSATICGGSSTNLTITATGPGTLSGTLSDGTPFSGTAPTITVSVHPLSNTTYTIATLTNGTCSAASGNLSGSATVTISTPPSATISYSGSPFCYNVGTAAVTLTGTAGGTFSSTASINAASGLVNLVATAPGIYTVTYTVAASGGCASYSTNASIVINPNTWIGAISSNWTTGGNWAGNGMANTCPVYTILSTAPYQPILTSGTIAVQDLIINAGSILTVSNSTMQISGTISNSGTFSASNGSIEMNGSAAQTIPASTFQNNALYNLIISNTSTSGVSLGGALDIYGSVTYSATGMTLVTNDTLTFKSNASGTAFLGNMTGNTITGEATVERYLSARKGWRLLSAPTDTKQTVQQAWQEGCGAGANCVAGFGIQISGTGGTAAGFDVYSPSPALKTYNSATGGFVAVPNTNSGGIASVYGYFVFVRGDRSVTSPFAAPTTTVVRTKGTLYVGDQPAITVSANQFTAIGNPYASAIDMRNITKSGLKDFFYVWDPALSGASGYGAYQTFSNNGSGNYVVTPGGGSYGSPGSISNDIESGQAFLVQATASGGTITLKEGAKTTGSSLVSTPAGLPAPALSISLYGVNANSTTYMADGLLVNYGDNFSNKIDSLDGLKQLNGSENLATQTAGQLLVVERRHTITAQDTIFLNMTGVSAHGYQFQLNANNLYQPGLSGFLIDNYLKTNTPLTLSGTTSVTFAVTGAAGSYAANRFMIVFSQLEALPVTFTSVNAIQQGANIVVNWQVDNEMNIKQYETEKSTDGSVFSTIGITAPSANNGGSAGYETVDNNPSQGANFYRIKSVDIKGSINFSKVVKVTTENAQQDITVFPNPVTDGTIHLELLNQPAGTYGVRLTSKTGQLIFEKQIIHAAGTSIEQIRLDKYLPHGIYQVQVSGSSGTYTSLNIVY